MVVIKDREKLRDSARKKLLWQIAWREPQKLDYYKNSTKGQAAIERKLDKLFSLAEQGKPAPVRWYTDKSDETKRAGSVSSGSAEVSSGSAEVSPGLRKAQLTDKDYERILTAGAEVIAAEARSIVERTAKRKTGRLQSSITYRLSPALTSPKATMGWDEQPLGSTSTYVDGQGRSRKVETVADYARILEYSDRRQLRHMEAARDLCEDAALDAMEREADAAMGRLADAFEQDTF